MPKYIVSFNNEDLGGPREIVASHPDDAAEGFAHWAEHNLDMWEHLDDYWSDEYSVKVVDPDGNVARFSITRKHVTFFQAEEAR